MASSSSSTRAYAYGSAAALALALALYHRAALRRRAHAHAQLVMRVMPPLRDGWSLDLRGALGAARAAAKAAEAFEPIACPVRFLYLGDAARKACEVVRGELASQLEHADFVSLEALTLLELVESDPAAWVFAVECEAGGATRGLVQLIVELLKVRQVCASGGAPKGMTKPPLAGQPFAVLALARPHAGAGDGLERRCADAGRLGAALEALGAVALCELGSGDLGQPPARVLEEVVLPWAELLREGLAEIGS